MNRHLLRYPSLRWYRYICYNSRPRDVVHGPRTMVLPSRQRTILGKCSGRGQASMGGPSPAGVRRYSAPSQSLKSSSQADGLSSGAFLLVFLLIVMLIYL